MVSQKIYVPMGVYKKKSDLVRIIKMKTDNTNKKNFEP